MVLAAGARVVRSAERRGRLCAQVERRAIFQLDLTAAVTALGGVPARHAAGAARLAAGARRVHQLLMGPHEGDAYAACARATETTANAYAKALSLRLPSDVRFGVERQNAEVEWDCGELRRLRWGGTLAPLPGPSVDGQTEGAQASAPNDLDSARALEVWSEEGGPGPGRA